MFKSFLQRLALGILVGGTCLILWAIMVAIGQAILIGVRL